MNSQKTFERYLNILANELIYQYNKGKTVNSINDRMRKENTMFFLQIIRKTRNRGFYIYPIHQSIYQIIIGKLYGNKRAIKLIKDITLKSFHKFLIVDNKVNFHYAYSEIKKLNEK